MISISESEDWKHEAILLGSFRPPWVESLTSSISGEDLTERDGPAFGVDSGSVLLRFKGS